MILLLQEEKPRKEQTILLLQEEKPRKEQTKEHKKVKAIIYAAVDTAVTGITAEHIEGYHDMVNNDMLLSKVLQNWDDKRAGGDFDMVSLGVPKKYA